MSSIDGPNSPLAPGMTSVPSGIIPRTLTPTRSVLSGHKNIQDEEIELSEVNAKPPQRKSEEIHVSQTNKSSKLRERIQFFALCWAIFFAGWCDGSTGPLLPRIQNAYHVLCFFRFGFGTFNEQPPLDRLDSLLFL